MTPCHGGIVSSHPIMNADITVSYEIRRHAVSRLYPVVLWQPRRSGTPKCALRVEAKRRSRYEFEMALRPFLRLALASSAAFKGQAADLPIFAPIFVSSN